MDWDELRQHAEKRPTMYLGDPARAHRRAILDCLRLVWQAKIFRRPQSVTVDLSPRQCVVRAMTGPLIRPIQRIFTFGGGETLSVPWQNQSREYFSRIAQEDEQHGLPFYRMRDRRDWRYCFSGPTGPRLNALGFLGPFTRLLCWGLRTDEGMWCEGWANGNPVGSPFLIQKASPIGFLVVADLDPHWFTGLPFTEEDARFFTNLSHRRYLNHPKQELWLEPRPLWTPGDIVAHWHPQDDLISENILTSDGLADYL